MPVVDDGMDGKDAAAVHLGFRIGEAGEDQAGTIDEAHRPVLAFKQHGLEMLCLARHGGDADALAAAKHVDERRLTDVRIADCANIQPVVRRLA